MLQRSLAYAVFLTATGMTSVSGTALAADTCQSVVADTVAEISAGAGADWSEADEALVRRAAGAACVKAQSGRYPDTLTEAPVAASAEAATDASQGEAAASAEKDDGSFEAGGITFRPLSGSPSQKSYERSRVDD